MNKNLMDVEAIRDTIIRTGEFRVHIKYGRGGPNGNTVTARLWHPDGFKVGRATGGGYDMRGSALGDAIEKFFQPELIALPGDTLTRGKLGIRASHSVDGACGVEAMLNLLEALGFKARLFETGKDACMVLAEKEGK